RPAAAHLGGDLCVLQRAPQAIAAHEQYVVRLERPAAAERHVGQYRITAQAALDEVAHRVCLCLLRADESLAQQQLHMTVVAAARHERAAPRVVEAAVADMRPPTRALLHQADRASGTWPLLERQLGSEPYHLRMCAPERQVQKAERIDERLW